MSTSPPHLPRRPAALAMIHLDRALIRRTGVAVLQLADEVDWGPEQPVRLVVGIAARSDEHIGVLAALTDVLDDRTLSTRLARATRVENVVAALPRATDASARLRRLDLAEPARLTGSFALEAVTGGGRGSGWGEVVVENVG